MTRTYTDEEHFAIAEFTGWKPDQRCSGKGDGWTVLNTSVVGVPPRVCQPSLTSTRIPSRCIHGMTSEHVILPPPLDDALAMACLRELGGWNRFADFWRYRNEVLPDDPRDAIFLAVLALRQELGIAGS